MKKVLLTLVAWAGIANIVYCQRCPAGSCHFNDSCFYYGNEKLFFLDAAAKCKALDGDLASIHSEDEENFLKTEVCLPYANSFPFIGLTCDAHTHCKWRDQTPLDYCNLYQRPWEYDTDSAFCGYFVNAPSVAYYGKWDFTAFQYNMRTQYLCRHKPAVSGTGFDTLSAVTAAEFKALKCQGMNFTIVHVLHNDSGLADNDGVSNILAASQANIADIGGYLVPCLKTSCPNAASQVQNVVTALQKIKSLVNYLWVDVELIEDANNNWSKHNTTNQIFVRDMVTAIVCSGYKPGIYTSASAWNEIMGKNFKLFSDLPLWYAHYDEAPNFTDFPTFGGWENPLVKQYQNYKNDPDTQWVNMRLDYKKF